MALDLAGMKAHCNVTGTTDDAVLTRLLAAAQKHVERLLGYALSDTVALPGGAPEDLEHAIYMLAADWYSNREATLVGVTAQPIPFGVASIVAEHRRYTFGLTDEVADNG
ncbi:head-tail connector protein [Mesorhizobium sp. J428]|uniref:head-tail connector protein n=1 Tax=Mesorhizobium sp. J428 TaxID=2898440 RepID=UPI002150BBC1|nr:head-tail connector protein [Mesorhizobium sp. J428]MCR5856573.1 head-tail connector protein [Mesorhizobium sp. J428]